VSGVPHLDVDSPEGHRTRRSALARPANQHDCQPRRVGRELALRGSRHSPLRPLAAAIARDPPDLRGDISTPNSRRSRARMGVLRSGFASAGESGYVRRSWQLDLPAGSLRRLAPPSAPAGSWAAGPCEAAARRRRRPRRRSEQACQHRLAPIQPARSSALTRPTRRAGTQPWSSPRAWSAQSGVIGGGWLPTFAVTVAVSWPYADPSHHLDPAS
jgi:hypothetical protein